MTLAFLIFCLAVAFITLLAVVLSAGFFGVVPYIILSVVCAVAGLLVGIWVEKHHGGNI